MMPMKFANNVKTLWKHGISHRFITEGADGGQGLFCVWLPPSGGSSMKRCEYCGYDIGNMASVTAYMELCKPNGVIIKKEPVRECGGKLVKIYYHKGCAGK